MKTFTPEELDELVALGKVVGYVGLGTQQVRVCEHGQRVQCDSGYIYYHYPYGPGSYDYRPCISMKPHRVFNCALIPYEELV